MGGRVMEWSSAPRAALLQSGGVRRADGSHRLLPGRGSGRSRALAAVVRGATVGPRGMLMAKKRWISRRWNQDSLVTSDRGEGRGKKRERQDNATGRLKGQG